MNRKLLIVAILIFMVVGCSAQKGEVNQSPKFTIAADVRNDAVIGVTPEIEQAILKSYLQQKAPKPSDDFKKIVNSLKLSDGTVYLVRTKLGFSTLFIEATAQKVLFVDRSESPSEPIPSGGFSIVSIKDQTKVFSKVAVGTFNIAEATKAVITWNDGHQTTHDLSNGTYIIEPKNNEYGLNQWEVFDSIGESLYKQKIEIAKKGSGGIEMLGLWLILGILIVLIIIYKILKKRRVL